MKTRDKMIVIRREGLIESILCDVTTCTILLGTFTLNKMFFDGAIPNWILAIMFFVFIFATNSNKRMKTYKKVSKEKLEKIEKILEE